MSQFPEGRDGTFRRLYAENFDSLLGYALRRVEQPEDAADVVAETFLVAWRRLADVPVGHESRLWLYGVARRTLANHRRGDRRRDALGTRLRADLATVVPDPAEQVTTDVMLEAALEPMSERDREVLLLSLWEGLEPREIATVLGVTALAARTRLSRARSRLRDVLGNDEPALGHVPGRQPLLAREEGR